MKHHVDNKTNSAHDKKQFSNETFSGVIFFFLKFFFERRNFTELSINRKQKKYSDLGSFKVKFLYVFFADKKNSFDSFSENEFF